MRLETERLILRRPEEGDAEAYLAVTNSEFVLRYNAMTPKTMESVLRSFSEATDETLLLERKDSGEIIGAVFTEEDSLRWGVKSKELSYFLTEGQARKGYMKEALHALIAHLFETEDIACVAARCFAPNQASLALLRSLGFHQDGYIPKCVMGYGGTVFDDTLHSLSILCFGKNSIKKPRKSVRISGVFLTTRNCRAFPACPAW